MSRAKYKRIVLKISGEALQGKRGFGIDADVIVSIAEQIKDVWRLGVEVAVVIGGGNFFRGLEETISKGMDRVIADYMECLLQYSMGLPCRTPWKKLMYLQGFRQPFRCRNWQSHI